MCKKNLSTSIQSEQYEICPISETQCPGVCIYSEIMKTVNIGIVVCDTKQNKILYANDLFSDLFGWRAGFDDYPSLNALMLPDLEESESSQYPYSPEHIQIDDKVLGYTAYHASDKFVWIFVRDITEKHQLEAVAEAVESSNNIGYIFSGVRHELGNPINSIKVALSVLKDNFDGYSRETVMKYLDRMLNDIERVEYLLHSLKNFNMHENKKSEEFDLRLFMEKFLSLVRNDVEKNGIELKHDLCTLPIMVTGDKRALHQVLLNILTNSVDALENSNDPYILLSTRRSANFVQISVEDNGCGISIDHQKELFKPFLTTKPKGTGLGLVISRKMLVSMNGTIDIESGRGTGTVVNITLLQKTESKSNNA